MPDGDEHAVDLALAQRAGFQVLEPHAVDLRWVVAAEHVVEYAVPDHVDLGVLEQPVLQDLFRAERVAAVHHGDLGGEIGVDIWGKEGTEIFAPLDGIVHSFAFNNNLGDYGATIILSHQLEAVSFFTLYGHLSYADLQNIHEGDHIKHGQQFAHFGNT